MSEMDRFDLKASALPVTPLTALEPCEPELAEPFAVIRPKRHTNPLVISSPHSGNIYPARFVEASQLDAVTLRRSEDAHVDRLLDHAPELGAVFMKAHFPRAYVDVNREPYELDPRMFDGALPSFVNSRSLRVAGGLGTIARVVGEAKDIYPRKLPVAEAFRRIDALYVPWPGHIKRINAAEGFGNWQLARIDILRLTHNARNCAKATSHPERARIHKAWQRSVEHARIKLIGLAIHVHISAGEMRFHENRAKLRCMVEQAIHMRIF